MSSGRLFGVNLPTIPIFSFVDAIDAVHRGELSSRVIKDLLMVADGFEKGQTILKYAREKGLIQKNDEGAVKVLVEKAWGRPV